MGLPGKGCTAHCTSEFRKISVMDANEFYREFTDRAKENNIILKGQAVSYPEALGKTYFEVYRNMERVYTELVNKNIVHSIIQDAYTDDKTEHLVAQHEYFRIDTIGYQHRYMEIPKNEAEKVALNRHFWDLKIAVEHENSKRDWMDEVAKLVHIRCPLKVVITYNHCDEREGKELEKLSYIAKWMRRIAAFDRDADEEYLIIIGNGAPRRRSSGGYSCFNYRGYLYQYHTASFERIG